MNEVFQGMEQRISANKMSYLDKEFTEIEIKEALLQMHLNKAPGPNGMITYFF